MKRLIKRSMKYYLVAGLCGLILGFSGITLAAHGTAKKTITIQVWSPQQVTALGFQANKQKGLLAKNYSKGGLGNNYSSSGHPAGVKYSFGIKVGGKSVSCGSKKLTENSVVKLILKTKDGKVVGCTNSVSNLKKS